MNFVRERYTGLCLFSFMVTSGFGLILAIFPRLIGWFIGLESILIPNSFFARTLGLVVFVIGFAYVMALVYEEAKNPLLVLATFEKILVSLYVLLAVLVGQIGAFGIVMLVVDGGIALFGIMAVRLPEDYEF